MWGSAQCLCLCLPCTCTVLVHEGKYIYYTILQIMMCGVKPRVCNNKGMQLRVWNDSAHLTTTCKSSLDSFSESLAVIFWGGRSQSPPPPLAHTPHVWNLWDHQSMSCSLHAQAREANNRGDYQEARQKGQYSLWLNLLAMIGYIALMIVGIVLGLLLAIANPANHWPFHQPSSHCSIHVVILNFLPNYLCVDITAVLCNPYFVNVHVLSGDRCFTWIGLLKFNSGCNIQFCVQLCVWIAWEKVASWIISAGSRALEASHAEEYIM